MGWRTIVVTKHAKISYRMEEVLIQTDDNLVQIPISDIQLMLIATTQVVITSHLLMELAEQNIRVIFTDKKKMPIGEFNPYYCNLNRNKNILNQIAWDEEKKGQLWQRIIKIKISNQAKLLTKLNRKKYNGMPAEDDLNNLIAQVNLGDKTNREAVAARIYFQRLFEINFKRRDDENLINAYLNFSYTVLLSIITQEICSAGYLTELGIHHDNMENVYNLSSDFIEPFRVFVDEIAFSKSNSTSFDLDDKLELINLLNQDIVTSKGEFLLSNFMKSFVRKCLNYMSNKNQKLPEFDCQL
ncbi:MAG: type II CRISPR-associated endonuclease Cas1 [Lactobacillaceae bacterium]